MHNFIPFLRQEKNAVLLNIRVSTKAKKTKIIGQHGSQLRINVHAIPERSKANQELITFFAQLLHKRKNEISICHGKTSRNKTLRIENLRISDRVLKKLVENE